MEFEVTNLKCGGCANTITKRLKERFENVSVDVEKKIVKIETQDCSNELKDEIASMLRSLGYPIVGDDRGAIDDGIAKVKSFISCASGKF